MHAAALGHCIRLRISGNNVYTLPFKRSYG